MRNYPDEVVLMEIARAERRVQRSHAVTPNLAPRALGNQHRPIVRFCGPAGCWWMKHCSLCGRKIMTSR